MLASLNDVADDLWTEVSDVQMLAQVVQYACSAFMVLGGAMPYVPQYLHIKRTDNSEGFSLYTCLVLIIANTLRIVFWFGHRFELPLLLQGIVMNITMFVMIHCCVTSRNRSQISPREPERIFTDFNWEHFWAWSDVQSYVEFVITFATLSTLAMHMFFDWPVFVEGIGTVALLTEAMLAAPQFYWNMKTKSTKGMSRKMVLMWLAGDLFKTGYFCARDAPLQFIICGGLQVLLDLCVIAQCFIYSNSRKLNLIN